MLDPFQFKLFSDSLKLNIYVSFSLLTTKENIILYIMIYVILYIYNIYCIFYIYTHIYT